LEPYRYDAVFTQSPLNVESPWKNANQSALLHREVSVTAFQYPFAINVEDCHVDDPEKKDWFTKLMKAVSELNDVAGNHARSYFEMAPASIVLRLTESRVAGYDTYGFQSDGSFPEVVEGILAGDYPAGEFYLGGLLVREVLSAEKRNTLQEKGAHLYRMAAQALDAVSKKVCGTGFLEA
jgi:CRISPR-associated protein Cst2